MKLPEQPKRFMEDPEQPIMNLVHNRSQVLMGKTQSNLHEPKLDSVSLSEIDTQVVCNK